MRTFRIGLLSAATAFSLAVVPAWAAPCKVKGNVAKAQKAFHAGLFDEAVSKLESADELFCFFRHTQGDDARMRQSLLGLGDSLLASAQEATGSRALRFLETAELAYRRGLVQGGRGASAVALTEVLMLQIIDYDRDYLIGEVESRLMEVLRREEAGSREAHWAEGMKTDLEALRAEGDSFDGAARSKVPTHVGGEVRPPVRLSAVPPQYTEPARKARVQGVVIVQAIIDTEGNVAQSRVLRGLPLGLSANAINAISQWQFEPATLGGRPVPVYYNLTVNFRLQ